MDDQWNIWVRIGVRKLVLLDDMTEQAGNRVGQNYNSTFTSPSIVTWNPYVPVRRGVAVLDNQFSFCHELWDMARDNELDQTGGDLIKQIGWDWLEGGQALPNTPVSYWSIQTTIGGKHTIVD
jgi:hypothetical protein